MTGAQAVGGFRPNGRNCGRANHVDAWVDDRTALELLAQERASTLVLIASLTGQLDAIFEGSTYTTHDDEHDPEGATVAYERAKVQGLLSRACSDLKALDHAEQKLQLGGYGFCQQCGVAIAEARLVALPATTTCIDCAPRTRR